MLCFCAGPGPCLLGTAAKGIAHGKRIPGGKRVQHSKATQVGAPGAEGKCSFLCPNNHSGNKRPLEERGGNSVCRRESGPKCVPSKEGPCLCVLDLSPLALLVYVQHHERARRVLPAASQAPHSPVSKQVFGECQCNECPCLLPGAGGCGGRVNMAPALRAVF